MLQLIDEDDLFNIYINGKLFSSASYYSSDSDLISMDDYPALDFRRIAKMNALDFPDNFCLSWSAKPELSPVFDCFDITRKGNKITVQLDGWISLHDRSYDWLLWNPRHLLKQMQLLAKTKGIKAWYRKSECLISLTFNLKTEGTLGSVFYKALKGTVSLQRHAEVTLLKTAVKKMKY